MKDGRQWVRRRPRAGVGQGERRPQEAQTTQGDALAAVKQMFDQPVPAGQVMRLMLDMQTKHEEELDLAHSLVAVACARLGGWFRVTREEAEALRGEGEHSLFIKRRKGTVVCVVAPRESDPESFNRYFVDEYTGGDDDSAA